jgi:hypothetical protein
VLVHADEGDVEHLRGACCVLRSEAPSSNECIVSRAAAHSCVCTVAARWCAREDMLGCVGRQSARQSRRTNAPQHSPRACRNPRVATRACHSTPYSGAENSRMRRCSSGQR